MDHSRSLLSRSIGRYLCPHPASYSYSLDFQGLLSVGYGEATLYCQSRLMTLLIQGIDSSLQHYIGLHPYFHQNAMNMALEEDPCVPTGSMCRMS